MSFSRWQLENQFQMAYFARFAHFSSARVCRGNYLQHSPRWVQSIENGNPIIYVYLISLDATKIFSIHVHMYVAKCLRAHLFECVYVYRCVFDIWVAKRVWQILKVVALSQLKHTSLICFLRVCQIAFIEKYTYIMCVCMYIYVYVRTRIYKSPRGLVYMHMCMFMY